LEGYKRRYINKTMRSIFLHAITPHHSAKNRKENDRIQWFVANNWKLIDAIERKITPEVVRLVERELAELGFYKAFPIEKE